MNHDNKSRLEQLISRFLSQELVLNFGLKETSLSPFKILELGLGSGRTYDHLKKKSRKEVWSFDFSIDAHKTIDIDESRIIIGDITKTFPNFCQSTHDRFCLVHIDIGTRDLVRDKELYDMLTPHLLSICSLETIIMSDRELTLSDRWSIIQLKDDKQLLENWPYFIYKQSR